MKIDYLGISYNVVDKPFSALLADEREAALFGLVPPPLTGGLDLRKGTRIHRKPYREGIQFSQGFSVFWGGQDTVLVEISGQGCAKTDIIDFLRLANGKPGLLTINKVTRLDIAYDMDSDMSPYEIAVAVGIQKRIKTRNIHNSQTGQTFYIGSRKSDRFCRVYRYNEPHPRAGIPRVEFQFGKKVSNRIVDQLLSGVTVESIFKTAWDATFDRAFDGIDYEEADITRVNEKGDANTVVWFYKQVVPALARLVQKGELSMEEIFTAIGDARDNA